LREDFRSRPYPGILLIFMALATARDWTPDALIQETRLRDPSL